MLIMAEMIVMRIRDYTDNNNVSDSGNDEILVMIMITINIMKMIIIMSKY